MPTDAWEAANGSSSEEEESDEEPPSVSPIRVRIPKTNGDGEPLDVVVAPRRQGGMFRVANSNTSTQNAPAPPAANPAAAKSAMLTQIKGMAGERQAHEEVVTVAASTEKSDAEKKALEARQQLLAAQNAAKAAQAAAIQQAALKATGNQSASKQQAEAEAEMRAKQAQAQAQAEAEKKKAEERVAAQRAAQQEALAKAQEAAKKAQADALAKAQAAKQEAEARAKAQQAASQQQKPAAPAAPSTQQQTLHQAQQQQQNRAQAEAQARAAQAKAQAEAQARAMQAKAQAEADAKARAAAAQAQQQKQAPAAKPAAPAAAAPAKPAAPAAAPAKPAAAPAPSKFAAPAAAPKTAAPAAANGTAKTGVATANGAPKTMQQGQSAAVPQQRMGQEISRPHVQSTRTALPAPAAAAPKAAPAAQTPQQQPRPSPSQQTAVAPQMKPNVQMTRGNVGFDAQSANNATPVPVGHTQLKTPGKVVVPQLQQEEIQKEPAQKPGQTALKHAAKVTEEVLSNEQIRTISNTSSNRPTMRADGVAGRFVEQENTPAPLQSVTRGSKLEGAKKWEEERAREAEASNMGQTEVPGGVRLNDDACWQTQHRVPVEVAAPQIGKIAIPELKETHETQPTVIVRKPAGYEKVKWNEFPEEIQPERQSAPRTKAQEWVPVNNEVTEITRTGFASGKVNKVWPPPADEITKDAGQVNRVKVGDDLGWIRQEQQEVIKSVPRTSRISRAWPPPEDERGQFAVQTAHMPVVQWPPPEFEQMEQEKIEVLAKHIPAKKMGERQWPPPPPQYYIPGNENAVN